jgi:hypothetical protein
MLGAGRLGEPGLCRAHHVPEQLCLEAGSLDKAAKSSSDLPKVRTSSSL